MIRFVIYALLAGILLSLSFPTIGFPFLAFFGFVPLMLAEHKIAQSEEKWKGSKVFLLSYIAFVVWNAGCIHWLYGAMQFDSNGELQHSIPALVPPILLNGLFMAIVFSLYSFVKKKAGNYYGLFFLPCIWMSFENLHLNWELAFPWLNLGNAFSAYPSFIQWYEYTGAFGGSLWIWIGNLIAFYCVVAYMNTKEKAYLIRLALGLGGLILFPTALSQYMYHTYEENGKEITALVLQPELNPYTEKYDLQPVEIVEQLTRMATPQETAGVDFVVAPETAFPGPGPGIFISNLEKDFLIQKLKRWQKQQPKTILISGVELLKKYPNEALATPTARQIGNSFWYADSFNSALQLQPKDSIQYYHKSKLLVGIEQFPYAGILKPLLGNLLLDFGGTVAGMGKQEKRSVFRNALNEAVVAPVICYESVFGQFVTEFIQEGANVLFIMSNDSWWGESDGHRELFLYGNLRAIETRRSIVRAANSGISGFINQRGDVISKTPYGIETQLKGSVKLNDEITTYVKYGDFIARIALLFAGIILAFTLSQFIINRIPKRKA